MCEDHIKLTWEKGGSNSGAQRKARCPENKYISSVKFYDSLHLKMLWYSKIYVYLFLGFKLL